MKNWMLAIRPKTLFASLAPVVLGTAIAYFQQGQIKPLVFVITLICALLLQIASNLANDYLDFAKGVDNEERLGPVRVTSAGLISSTKMKNALIFVLFLSFLFGIYLMWIGGPIIMAMGLLSLYFAYGYTGGPFPLSYNGLGELAAFIFFGLIAVTGTTYLQTRSFTALGCFLAMGPGFISACILAINNLRDIKSDEETKKRTLAVRFGERFQRTLCLWLIAMSGLVVVFAGAFYQLKWLIPVCLLPLFFIRNWLRILRGEIDGKLNLALARTAQYNLLYCLMIAAALFLIKRYY
jgi:1,4-dihydroxy-2-naphthoate octaprenyltransferase